MSLAGTAKETLAIVERGSYQAPSGNTVALRAQLDAAIRGTVLYRPEELDHLIAAAATSAAGAPPRIDVTPETTAQACRRLVESECVPHVVALNFASAKNPGGGFLGGAKAQEEDLARCSALYSCQLTQRAYYDANRATASMLYTDHIIYSPDVPFFRDERLDLLEAPFLVSVITVPAPNAGEALRRDPLAGPHIHATLESRTAKLLAVAAHRAHRCLVLGAWGCGVFRNQPAEVAAVFHRWLDDARFRGAFDRVVFAVYDRSAEQLTLRAFARQFAANR
jgi:uncharacterized protein (TIGR02452 family)